MQMARRRRRNHHRSRTPLSWVWWALPLGVVTLMVALGLGAVAWVKAYVRGEAFREQLSRQVSGALGVDGSFSPLAWEDDSVYSDGFVPDGESQAPAGRQIDAQGIRAKIDWSSFRQAAWRVPEVVIQRLQFDADTAAPAQVTSVAVESNDSSGGKSIWSRWLPQSVDLGVVRAEDFNLTLHASGKPVLTARGLPIEFSAGGEARAWDILARSGGELTIADKKPLPVEGMSLRYRSGDWYLNALRLAPTETAKLTVDGESTATGKFRFDSKFQGVRAGDVVAADWRQRLVGRIDGEIKSTGAWKIRKQAVHEGEVKLNEGVLTALPVLDKLAEHTRSDRFRRLVMDQAEFKFTYLGPGKEREKSLLSIELEVVSDRLLKITGRIEVANVLDSEGARPLSGVLLVGVDREVLKWLPGAEERVFTSAKGGYLFTTMRLGGTLDALEEDLSPRLRRAAVVETVGAVPGTAIDVGRGVLDTTAGLLGRPLGGALEDLGKGVLDQADGVVESGLQMVPLLGNGGR